MQFVYTYYNMIYAVVVLWYSWKLWEKGEEGGGGKKGDYVIQKNNFVGDVKTKNF